ncbi:MAG: cytochrome c biogenesis protein [Synechococcaceae cyanobacterium SM2_3_1]|nr:cytochrome c biogenesis protein [Synechococcaceae cyanobacterium SM2_3_1]
MNQIKRYLRRELLPLLADLKLAIGLLLTIALASASGTVIEQDQPLTFYQANYPEDPALFGFLSWRVIQFLGLDQVYRTPWFLALLILFGSSLTACTYTRQWPMLKVARRWSYYKKPASFAKLSLSTCESQESVQQLSPLLEQRGYTLFTEADQLYARKGLLGKIGPIVVHASMLLILVGAIAGIMTGFKGQALIPAGSTAPIQTYTAMGEWAQSHLPDWQIQVNRFWIDYSPEGRIRQFYSDLSLVSETGEALTRKTIHVNQPLSYEGVTLYQADWSISAVVVRVNGSPPLQIPVRKLQSETGAQLWGAFIPTRPDFTAGVTLILPDLQGTTLLYDEAGELIGPLRRGMSQALSDRLTLYLDEVIGSTGLQIKSDPGIPLVYAGFALLMLGVMMSYVSYNQIWALQTGEGLYIGGKANRALVSFEREFMQILSQLRQTSAEVNATLDPDPLVTRF